MLYFANMTTIFLHIATGSRVTKHPLFSKSCIGILTYMASVTPLTTVHPVFMFSLPILKASHIWWSLPETVLLKLNISPTHSLLAFHCQMNRPKIYLFLCLCLTLWTPYKLKGETVTPNNACSLQTTAVWWNSEEHSGCSLHQQKIMGLEFSRHWCCVMHMWSRQYKTLDDKVKHVGCSS